MIAELYGKATGVAKGKAGSMHLIDVSAGVMGASAVVASSISQAVGYALALRMRGESRAVACFFGDGAVEEGTFHESLNFASLKRLPVLFVCENNAYAIHSRQCDRQATSDICTLARAHGLTARRLPDQDPYRIYTNACQALEELRSGQSGPVLLECCCYRWLEHVGPNEDFQAGYRARDEAAPWIERDALRVVARKLTENQRLEIEQEVECEICEAFAAAENDRFPDERELYTDLYWPTEP
jgi:TPP-dependent pyruvate/acetoin dehydrogenase alpha subunit